jgi:hypothetical protein
MAFGVDWHGADSTAQSTFRTLPAPAWRRPQNPWHRRESPSEKSKNEERLPRWTWPPESWRLCARQQTAAAPKRGCSFATCSSIEPGYGSCGATSALSKRPEPGWRRPARVRARGHQKNAPAREGTSAARGLASSRSGESIGRRTQSGVRVAMRGAAVAWRAECLGPVRTIRARLRPVTAPSRRWQGSERGFSVGQSQASLQTRPPVRPSLWPTQRCHRCWPDRRPPTRLQRPPRRGIRASCRPRCG